VTEASLTATEPFVFEVGDPGAELAGPEALMEAANQPERGLALAEVTLERDYDHSLLGRLFRRRRENELFFITMAFDMSGAEPTVYPAKPDEAANAWIPLKPGDVHRFSLGVGMPLWGPRPLVGGVALTIIVAESDKSIQNVGQHMTKAAEALKSDVDVVDFLAKLVTGPASIPADMVFGVLGKAAATAGAILENNHHDHIGLFRGVFPASYDSWDGMLEQSQAGASIKLKEV
jgi:hypothetical protein